MDKIGLELCWIDASMRAVELEASCVLNHKLLEEFKRGIAYDRELIQSTIEDLDQDIMPVIHEVKLRSRLRFEYINALRSVDIRGG